MSMASKYSPAKHKRRLRSSIFEQSSSDAAENQSLQMGQLPGHEPPTQVRTIKEYDKMISDLRQENFDLKLRLYLLEGKFNKKFDESSREVHLNNIQLKMDLDRLQKELERKSSSQEKLMVDLKRSEERHKSELDVLRKMADNQASELQERIKHLAEELQHFQNQDQTMESSEIYKCAFGLEDASLQAASLEAKELLNDKMQLIKDLIEAKDIIMNREEALKKMENELQSAKQKIISLEEDAEKSDMTIQSLVSAAKSKPSTSSSVNDNYDTFSNENFSDNDICSKQLSSNYGNPQLNLQKEMENLKQQLANKIEELQEAEMKINEQKEKIQHLQLRASKRDVTIQGLVMMVQNKEKEVAELSRQKSEDDSSEKTLSKVNEMATRELKSLETENQNLHATLRKKDLFIQELLNERSKIGIENEKTVQNLLSNLRKRDTYIQDMELRQRESNLDPEKNSNLYKYSYEMLKASATEMEMQQLQDEEKNFALKETECNFLRQSLKEKDKMLNFVQVEYKELQIEYAKLHEHLSEQGRQSDVFNEKLLTILTTLNKNDDRNKSKRSSSDSDVNKMKLNLYSEQEDLFEELSAKLHDLDIAKKQELQAKNFELDNLQMMLLNTEEELRSAQKELNDIKSSLSERERAITANTSDTKSLVNYVPNKEIEVRKSDELDENFPEKDSTSDISENRGLKIDLHVLVKKTIIATEENAEEIALSSPLHNDEKAISNLELESEWLRENVNEKDNELAQLQIRCQDLEEELISLKIKHHQALVKASQRESLLQLGIIKPPVLRSSSSTQTDVVSKPKNILTSSDISNLSDKSSSLEYETKMKKLNDENFELTSANENEDESLLAIREQLLERLEELNSFLENLLQYAETGKFDSSAFTTEEISSFLKCVHQSKLLSETLSRSLIDSDQSLLKDEDESKDAKSNKTENQHHDDEPDSYFEDDKVEGRMMLVKSGEDVKNRGDSGQISNNHQSPFSLKPEEISECASAESLNETLISEQLVVLEASDSDDILLYLNDQGYPENVLLRSKSDEKCKEESNSLFGLNLNAKQKQNNWMESEMFNLNVSQEQLNNDSSMVNEQRFRTIPISDNGHNDLISVYGHPRLCNASSDSDIWSEPDRNVSLQRIGMQLRGFQQNSLSGDQHRSPRKMFDSYSSCSSFAKGKSRTRTATGYRKNKYPISENRQGLENIEAIHAEKCHQEIEQKLEKFLQKSEHLCNQLLQILTSQKDQGASNLPVIQQYLEVFKSHEENLLKAINSWKDNLNEPVTSNVTENAVKEEINKRQIIENELNKIKNHLEECEQNLKDVTSNFELKKKEVGSLRDKNNELQNDISELQNNLEAGLNKVSKIEQEKAELKRKLSYESQEHKQLQEWVKKLQNENIEVKKEKTSYEEKYLTADKIAVQLKEDLSSLRERLKELHSKYEKIKLELMEANSQKDNYSKDKNRLEGELVLKDQAILNFENKLTKFSQQLKIKIDHCMELKLLKGQMSPKKAEIKSQIIPANVDLNLEVYLRNIDEIYEKVQNGIANYETNAETLKAQVLSLDESLKDTERSLDILRKDNEGLERKKLKLERSFTEQSQSLEKIALERNNLEGEVANLREEIKKKSELLVKLQQKEDICNQINEEKSLLKKSVSEMRLNIQSNENKLESFSNKCKDMELTVGRMEKENLDLKQHIASEKLKFQEKVSNLQDEMKNKCMSLEDEVSSLQMKLKDKEGYCDKIRDENSKLIKNNSEIQDKIKTVESNLKIITNRCQKYEETLHDLKRQKLESEQTFENEMQTLQVQLKDKETEYKIIIDEKSVLEGRISDIRQEIKNAKNNLQESVTKCKELKETLNELKEERLKSEQTFVSERTKLQKEIGILQGEINIKSASLEGEISALKIQFKDKEEDCKKIKDDKSTLEKQLSEMQQKIINSENSLQVSTRKSQELEEMFVTMKNEKLELEQAFTSSKTYLQDQMSTLHDKMSAKCTAFEKEILSLKTQLSEKDNSYESLNSRLNIQISDIQEQSNKNKRTSQESIIKYNALEKRSDKLKKEKVELEQKLQNQISDMQQKINKYEKTIQESAAKFKELQERADNLKKKKTELEQNFSEEKQKMKDEIHSLQIQLNKYTDEKSLLESRIVEIQSNFESHTMITKESSSKFEELQEIVDLLKRKNLDLECTNETLKSEISSLQIKLKDKEDYSEKLAAKRDSLENNIAKLKSKMEKEDHRAKFVSNKSGEKQHTHSELDLIIDDMEKRIENLESGRKPPKFKKSYSEETVKYPEDKEEYLKKIRQLKTDNAELIEKSKLLEKEKYEVLRQTPANLKMKKSVSTHRFKAVTFVKSKALDINEKCVAVNLQRDEQIHEEEEDDDDILREELNELKMTNIELERLVNEMEIMAEKSKSEKIFFHGKLNELLSVILVTDTERLETYADTEDIEEEVIKAKDQLNLLKEEIQKERSPKALDSYQKNSSQFNFAEYIHSLKQQLKDKEVALKECKENCRMLNSQLSQLKSDLREKDNLLHANKDAIRDLSHRLRHTLSETSQTEKLSTLKELEAQNSNVQQIINDLQTNVSELEKTLENTEFNCIVISKEKQFIGEQVQILSRHVNETSHQVLQSYHEEKKTLMEKIRLSKEENSNLEKCLHDLQAAFKDKDIHLKKVEERIYIGHVWLKTLLRLIQPILPKKTNDQINKLLDEECTEEDFHSKLTVIMQTSLSPSKVQDYEELKILLFDLQQKIKQYEENKKEDSGISVHSKNMEEELEPVKLPSNRSFATLDKKSLEQNIALQNEVSRLQKNLFEANNCIASYKKEISEYKSKLLSLERKIQSKNTFEDDQASSESIKLENLKEELQKAQKKLERSENLAKSLQVELKTYHKLNLEDNSKTDAEESDKIDKSLIMELLGEIRQLRCELEKVYRVNNHLRHKIEHISTQRLAAARNDTELRLTLSQSNSTDISSLTKAKDRNQSIDQDYLHMVRSQENLNQWSTKSPQYSSQRDLRDLPTNFKSSHHHVAIKRVEHTHLQYLDPEYLRSHHSSPDLGIESDPNHDFSAAEPPEKETFTRVPSSLSQISSASHSSLLIEDKQIRVQQKKEQAKAGKIDSAKLHAIGKLKDYELLKKEVLESIVEVKGMCARIKDRLISVPRSSDFQKNMEFSTLQAINSSCQNVELCLGEATSLLNKFWFAPYFHSESTDSDLVKKQNADLKEEITSMRLQVLGQTKQLNQAIERMSIAEKTKMNMERAINKQLTKTRKLLKKARKNEQESES